MPGALLPLLSFPLGLLLAPLARAWAIRVSHVDEVRGDRFAGAPTPRAGGIVVALAILPFVLLSARSPLVLALAAGYAVAFTTGALDDARGLSARAKLAGQALAALTSLTLSLRVMDPALAGVALPLPAWLAAGALWIVAFQNATNLIDNMDGVSGGVSLVALAALWLHLGGPGREAFVAVGGAIAAFLFFNVTRPPRLFLGDAGSLPIGHVLGLGSFWVLTTASDPARALAVPIALLVPLFDMAFVTVTRVARGRSIALGGRDHVAHRLYARLGSVDRARAVLWLGAVACAVVSLVAREVSPAGNVALWGGLLALAAVAAVGVARLPIPGSAASD